MLSKMPQLGTMADLRLGLAKGKRPFFEGVGSK